MENYNRVDKRTYEIYYYLNNKLHRIDGPAIEYISGFKYWYQNGELHRVDGPAYEYFCGNKWYY